MNMNEKFPHNQIPLFPAEEANSLISVLLKDYRSFSSCLAEAEKMPHIKKDYTPSAVIKEAVAIYARNKKLDDSIIVAAQARDDLRELFRDFFLRYVREEKAANDEMALGISRKEPKLPPPDHPAHPKSGKKPKKEWSSIEDSLPSGDK